jgi:carbon monoxide dehydrogenase subunit G
MQIEGKFTTNVPINKVWEATLNVDTIAACIPGVEGKTKMIDENTFENTIVQRVAFLKVKFNTTTVITLREPPTHLSFVTDGKDTLVGTTMNVKSNVYFKEISPNETEISYLADVRIVGKLATFGEGIMRKKSKEVGDEIAKNLRAKLEA